MSTGLLWPGRRGGGPRLFVRIGIVLALFLPACSAFSSDEPPVADSTLVQVLVELHLANARIEMQREIQRDLPAGIRDSILARHDLDEAQFNAAIAYYADHPEDFVALYSTVLDRLHAEADSTAR